MTTTEYRDQPIARPFDPRRTHSSRTKSRPVVRWVARALLLALLLPGPGISTPALAAPCPGTAEATLNLAGVFSFTSIGPSAPLIDLIGTGCAGAFKGDATGCSVVVTAPFPLLRATWPNTMARTEDPTGGCSFMCQNGDCVVRNNGLPVELLHFGVE